jgi:hypothetical protein
MRFLLAARGRRVLRRDWSRRGHIYGAGQVFDRLECPILGLMRHLRVPLQEIALLTSGMIGSPSCGPLVQAPRCPHRITSRRLGAIVVTVPVTVVAVGTQEEHLAASLAGHEP